MWIATDNDFAAVVLLLCLAIVTTGFNSAISVRNVIEIWPYNVDAEIRYVIQIEIITSRR